MDGWGFRAAQQVDPRLGRIPVVILSAVRDVRKHAAELHVIDYLIKLKAQGVKARSGESAATAPMFAGETDLTIGAFLGSLNAHAQHMHTELRLRAWIAANPDAVVVVRE